MDTFDIIPIYPEMCITLTPPAITSIIRDMVQVKTNDDVTISAKVIGGSGHGRCSIAL